MAIIKLDEMAMERLRTENHLLREQVRQLRYQLIEGGKNAPLSWGLTGQERRLYAHFSARELVTRESIMALLYSQKAAQPGSKIVDVWVCKLRRKLARQGVEIVTHWGVGWSLKNKQARAA